MIADGYDQFDSRHVAHLSGDRFGSGGLYDHNGSDGSGNVSNLGWGNAGFGGPNVNTANTATTTTTTSVYAPNQGLSIGGDYFADQIGNTGDY